MFTYLAANKHNFVKIKTDFTRHKILVKAEISITLDPTTPIFTETNWVGDSSKTEIINIKNDNENVDIRYYVSADWYPAATDSPQNARLLAERLNMVVIADPDGDADQLYDGKLADLIQEPGTGRELEGGADEDVEFELSLPTEAATDLIQGMAIEFDLVFVAVSD